MIVAPDEAAAASYAEQAATLGYSVADVYRTIDDAISHAAKRVDLYLVRGGASAPDDESTPLNAWATPVLHLIAADADPLLREHAERTLLGYLVVPCTPRELRLAIELLVWRRDTVRGGDTALAFENRYLCKNGLFRWLRWNASSDTGHRTMYSVARDVTDARRIETKRDTLVTDLQTALAEVHALKDFLPICFYCRRIREDENCWQTVESYISQHTKTRFSHGICPSCMDLEVEPQLRAIERET